ncbi:hypothetical protein [Glycomyces harbinensis]|uniref:EF-hand domain-containing protein n=1 Tax=Glycomyces harbinensis TaxID=58114 RepID=A0A1G7AZS3_9ACTN|nr:hypothetical protein [Glycomyces harbinensis]SDE20160.1 hypothetical protein SAMN05216270_11535 [Glycomyces harbinensis]
MPATFEFVETDSKFSLRFGLGEPHLDRDANGRLTPEEFVNAVVEYWSSTDPDAPATGG